MRLIVAGSRNITSVPENAQQLVQELWGEKPEEIVHGGCRGPDILLSQQFKDTPQTVFKPEWEKFGRAAGPIRNRQMADYGTHLLIVWDGKSKGSASMISAMKYLGKPVHEIIQS